MSDMSLRRAVLETSDSELLSSGAYDVTDSGLASASSQRTLPPHPLDPQAAPPTYVASTSLLIPAFCLYISDAVNLLLLLLLFTYYQTYMTKFKKTNSNTVKFDEI